MGLNRIRVTVRERREPERETEGRREGGRDGNRTSVMRLLYLSSAPFPQFPLLLACLALTSWLRDRQGTHTGFQQCGRREPAPSAPPSPPLGGQVHCPFTALKVLILGPGMQPFPLPARYGRRQERRALGKQGLFLLGIRHP